MRKRKRITGWKVFVGDRLFEISRSAERRDEIVGILKEIYPGYQIRTEENYD